MTISYTIKHYDSIDSTNLEARRLIGQNCGHGTVVTAESQTDGKGRLGRAWNSARGAGLWFSVVLEPRIPVHQVSLYSFAAAVSVAEGIQLSTGLSSQVKWPNDVLLKGRKVCGILLELVAERNQPVRVIIGIGINANQQMEDFPEDVQHKAVSLAMETGKSVDRQQVLDAVLERLAFYSAELEQNGFAAIRETWTALSCVSGKAVQIVQQGKPVLYGTALGLDDDGALLVQTEQGTERITAGDVSLRAADGGYAV